MTMRITRRAPEVDGVAIGEPVTIITQANRIKGAAATIEIGDITVGEADVVNSGTPNAAVLDFVLPRGKPGFNLVGAWDDEVEYDAYEAVTFGSSTYYALVDNDDVEPGTDPETWALVLDGSGAEDDREAAEAAAATATTQAGTATTQAGIATTQAGIATTQAGLAGTAKTAAETARDKAQDWAEEVEDTPVETGQFSALHHAAKAAGSAALAEDWAEGTEPGGPGTKSAMEWAAVAEAAVDIDASAVEFTPTGSIASTNVQAALAELDGDVTDSFDMDNMVDGAAKVAMTVAERAKLSDAVTASSAFANDNRALRSDGTAEGSQASDVTILDNGNVGLGTGAPGEKLVVVGNAYLTGTLDIGNATDATLSRSAAGRLAVEGKPVAHVEELAFRVGTPVSASGTSVTFASLACDDALIILDGVSHNNGSNTTIRFDLSTDNGATYPQGVVLTASAGASSLFYGIIKLSGLAEGYISGVFSTIGAKANWSSPNQDTSLSQWSIKMGGKVNAVRVSMTAGSFDAGTIALSQRG